MIAYMEILGIPLSVTVVIVAILFIINIVGEVLEFKGRAVPEFIKFRKYFARKKQEREALAQLPEAIKDLNDTVALVKDKQKDIDDSVAFVVEMKKHYDQDNISKRDKWINDVENEITTEHFKVQNIEGQVEKIEVIEGRVNDNDCQIQSLQLGMNAINKTLENMNNKMDKSDIEDKRTEILNFYYRITKNEDGYYPSKEEFKRADRLYKEYEELIEKIGDSNGEVDTAYKIIQEEFEKRMRNRSFVEDIRWGK